MLLAHHGVEGERAILSSKYVNPAKVVAPRGGSIPRNRMNDFKNRKALIGEYLSGKRSLSDYKR